MIKDSGERTEFATGAVRDMHAGKGRFDLLPWEGIHELARHCEDGALKYGEHNVDKGIPQHSLIDSAFRHLKRYLCGETDEPHLRAAAWNIMWALQQTVTHPELLDVPHVLSDDKRCERCIFISRRPAKTPCRSCIRAAPKGELGTDDFFLSR